MNPTTKTPCAVPRRFALLVTAALLSGGPAQAATYTWDGTTGSYGDAANWSSDIIPVAGDTAQLANGGTVQIGSGLTAPVSGNLNNFAVSNGTLAMSGGTLNTANLQVTGGTGIISLSGGSTTVTTDIRVAASNGQINISGDAQVFLPKFTIGSAAGVTGAAVTVSGNAVVTMNQNGGERELWIGGNNNGSGSLLLKDNAQWIYTRENTGTDFAIGRGSGSGVFTIQDSASLTYTGGSVAAAPIYVGGAPNFGNVAGTNTANAFHLNGGTVTAIGIHRFSGGAGTGVGTLNLNGGKIVAAAASANFFQGFTGTGGTGNNSVNILAGGVKFDTNGHAVTLTNALSGAGGLTKQGSGTLTLTGSNSYAGTTDVENGTLHLDAGATLAGAVTVDAGATLSGFGTIGGNTTIAGMHAVGASPGLQTFSSGLEYLATGVIAWELAANTDGDRGLATGYDAIDVTGGTVTVNSGATLNLVFNAAGSTVDFTAAFWAADRSWRIIDLGGSATDGGGEFTLGSVTLDANAMSSAGFGSFSVSKAGGDHHLNWIAAVPEPSAAFFGSLGLLGLLRRRRA